MTRNPNDSPLWAAIEELRSLLHANPLRAASVERGLTRFYDQSTLRIEDSNLDVTGTATVTGWLRVVGRIVLEGLGILTVNGLIELLGRMNVTGDIEILGGGKIKVGNVLIEDGKIKAGGMTIDPDEHGGAVTFPNGGQVFTDDDTIQVFLGNSVVQVSDTYARLQNGGSVIEINEGKARVSAGAVPPAATGEDVTALGMTNAGWLRRIPAS